MMIPLNLVLCFVLFLAIVLTAAVVVYVLGCRQTDKTSGPFFFFMLATVIYTGGYVFALLSDDVRGLFNSIRLEYIGISFFPALFIWLAVLFTMRDGLSAKLTVGASFALSAFLLAVVMTNDFHHLYYRSLELDASGTFVSPKPVTGPLYTVYAAFLLFSALFSVLRYAFKIRSAGKLERSRLFPMLIASSFPFLYAASVANGGFPWMLNMGPVFMMFACCIMTFGIHRTGFFDVSQRARKLAFNAMDEGFLVVLPDEEIVDWNPAVAKFFPGTGKTPPFSDLSSVSEEFAKLYRAMPVDGEAELVIPGAGSPRYFSVRKLRIADGKKQAGIALILRDITESKRHFDRLEELATHDFLTGIANRRQLMHLAQNECLRAQRLSLPLSVIAIDIDHFKAVNDGWGHAVGDEVLKAFAKTVRSLLRAADLFGRIGGEEFAVILPDSDRSVAFTTAERLRSAIASPDFFMADPKIPVTASFGVAGNWQGDSDNGLESLFRRADKALYRAKNSGRNRIESI